MTSRFLISFIFATTALSAAGTYFPPPDKDGGWREAKAERKMREVAGMDLSRLEPAWTVTEKTTANAGLLVVRKGWLVYERYLGKASRNANPDMASTGKAFCSIACGIMLNEFKDKIPEGLETKVFTEKYLPQAFPLDDPRKANITLAQLLCMTAGYWGEGQTPSGIVKGGRPQPLKPVKGQDVREIDESSLRVPLWCDPGEGYSYSSPSPHIASIVLRNVSGMELKDYINERLARPQGWGDWNYCLYRGDVVMQHANGAGSTALHATDVMRFGYCLAHEGKWKDQQLVPWDYIRRCQSQSYNPHAPFCLQWEHNADGHVAAAPKDAFWKSGAGGFCLYVVPSLDLVIYKMGGKDQQYDEKLTRIPQPPPSTDRTGWEPSPAGPFSEGSLGGNNGLYRILELVCGAVRLE
ncbi:MAG: serine hydrolase domain-containing protein [Prosthecobacter sp.]